MAGFAILEVKHDDGTWEPVLTGDRVLVGLMFEEVEYAGVLARMTAFPEGDSA